MLISRLGLMQQYPRYIRFDDMIKHVKNRGIWDKASLKNNGSLIKISLFEDGAFYVHDGFHRILATLWADRDYLYPQEYEITKWTYAQYMEINFKNKWVTPFDPRIQSRKADFCEFKRTVFKLAKESEEKATQFINDNKHLYLERKDRDYFGQLVMKFSNLENYTVEEGMFYERFIR